MNLNSGRQAIANLTSSTPSTFLSSMDYRYVFKLNHSNLPIFDLTELSTTMTYIENEITENTGITETLTDYITNAVTSIQSDLELFEVVSLAVSIPAVVLGIYLTMTLYNLALEQRRSGIWTDESSRCEIRRYIEIILNRRIVYCDCRRNRWIIIRVRNLLWFN